MFAVEFPFIALVITDPEHLVCIDLVCKDTVFARASIALTYLDITALDPLENWLCMQ
jgi:hypothetical protein